MLWFRSCIITFNCGSVKAKNGARDRTQFVPIASNQLSQHCRPGIIKTSCLLIHGRRWITKLQSRQFQKTIASGCGEITGLLEWRCMHGAAVAGGGRRWSGRCAVGGAWTWTGANSAAKHQVSEACTCVPAAAAGRDAALMQRDARDHCSPRRQPRLGTDHLSPVRLARLITLDAAAWATAPTTCMTATDQTPAVRPEPATHPPCVQIALDDNENTADCCLFHFHE